MKRQITGIDQSLTNTYISWHPTREPFRVRGLLPKEHMAKRLYFWLRDVGQYLLQIEKQIKAERYIAAIEGYAYGARQQQLSGELGGLLRRELYLLGWDILVVQPTQLKKFICAAGNAPKSAVMMHVNDKYGYLSANDNDADAKALEIIGCCYMGFASYNGVKFTAAQKKSVKNLQLWRSDQ